MGRSPIALGVIGLGRIGRVHARILARGVRGAALVAVADVQGERARRTALDLGVDHWYDGPDDLLNLHRLQGVILATPSHTHAALVELAARAGLAILCEKPLALTLEDTDRAIIAAERAGVSLQVGFMRRTQPAYLRLKRSIEAGRLGRPLLFRSTQRDRESPPAAFCDPAVSGGIFVDMGIHEFDLASWLLQDEVDAVQAFGSALDYQELRAVGDLDNAVVNLSFRGGAVGTVDLSRSARYGEDIRTEVVGSKSGGFVGELPPRTPAGEAAADEPYRPQMQAFVDAIRKGGTLAATGQDSRSALAVALAARRSAEIGKVVRLPG